MSSSSGRNHSAFTSPGANTINSNHHQQHHHVQSQQSIANSQARLDQLFDEQDHKRCSDGNRKALLAENLDQLRGLVKALEADDWKYHTSGPNNNIAWSTTTRVASDGNPGTR